MKLSLTQKCFNCEFFVGGSPLMFGEDGYGECRRRPPTREVKHNSFPADNHYPIITEYSDCCGEFQTKES